MTRKQAYRTTCAAVAIVAMLQNAALAADPVLIPAGANGTAGAQQYRDVNAATSLSNSAKIQALRQKVKYVFVIFQENRSFDHYFGTYPGANGLFDASGELITSNLGAKQLILDTDGVTFTEISPFLIPATIEDVNGNTVQMYPEATASVDHSHTGIVDSAHFKEATNPKTAQNNGYALDEEGLQFASGASSAASTVIQKGTTNTPPPTAVAGEEADG